MLRHNLLFIGVSLLIGMPLAFAALSLSQADPEFVAVSEFWHSSSVLVIQSLDTADQLLQKAQFLAAARQFVEDSGTICLVLITIGLGFSRLFFQWQDSQWRAPVVGAIIGFCSGLIVTPILVLVIMHVGMKEQHWSLGGELLMGMMVDCTAGVLVNPLFAVLGALIASRKARERKAAAAKLQKHLTALPDCV